MLSLTVYYNWDNKREKGHPGGKLLHKVNNNIRHAQKPQQSKKSDKKFSVEDFTTKLQRQSIAFEDKIFNKPLCIKCLTLITC